MAYFRNTNLFYAGQVNTETTQSHFSIIFALVGMVLKLSIPLACDLYACDLYDLVQVKGHVKKTHWYSSLMHQIGEGEETG